MQEHRLFAAEELTEKNSSRGADTSGGAPNAVGLYKHARLYLLDLLAAQRCTLRPLAARRVNNVARTPLVWPAGPLDAVQKNVAAGPSITQARRLASATRFWNPQFVQNNSAAPHAAARWFHVNTPVVCWLLSQAAPPGFSLHDAYARIAS